MARVSVVLPTYNGEKFLGKSIESVIGQSYKDLELIIVDDCSTDNTFQIVKEYCDIDDRIIYVKNEVNKKLPISLNRGFIEASGEYLTWTSDDNIYERNAIEEMVSFLDKHQEFQMVRADMQLIDEEDRIIDKSEAFTPKKLMIHNCVGACFLYRRNVLIEVGDYDGDLFCVEDYDYWMRVQSNFGDIGTISKELYRYRCHGASLTQQKRELVQRQLKKMRLIHKNLIINRLSSSNEDLLALYEILRMIGMKSEEMPCQIFDSIPFLQNDSVVEYNKPFIIYGAGEYGTKAFRVLEGNVEYFIDRRAELMTNGKLGKKIESPKEGLKDVDKYNLIIAMSYDKLDGIFSVLEEFGVERYTTLSYLMQQMEETKLHE